MGSPEPLRIGAALPGPLQAYSSGGVQVAIDANAVLRGRWVTAAEGSGKVERVTITDGQRTWQRECDYLACAYGLLPNLQWPRFLGSAVEQDVLGQDAVVVDPYQGTTVPHVYCAGEVAGIAGIDAALVAGQIAGFAAAGHDAEARRLFRARARGQRFAAALARAFRLRPESFRSPPNRPSSAAVKM